MSIVTELAALDNTKQSIKQAIINKGQDLTGVNFAGYAAKIDAITTGSGGGESTTNEWTEAYWQSELAKVSIRDPEWLAIPTLLESDTKFVGLHAIPEGESFLALKAAGNYTIDWGDGVIENFNANVIAYHSYDYDLVDVSNTTLTSKGYKQVIVQVYPQAGQSFTLIDINLKHNKLALLKYSTGFLEISIAGINLSTVTISGSTQNVYHKMLKSFSLNTNSVTNMSYMLTGCSSLKTIPLFKLHPSFPKDMSYMFSECSSLTTIPLIDTFTVINMNNMFYNCPALTTISFLNTINVTNISNMFHTCPSLTTIPLLNTSKATLASGMFYGCKSLTTIPLLDTIKVTTMSAMFSECGSLITIPLLDTNSVTLMGNMFYNCPALTTIPLLNVSKVTDMTNMFKHCSSLKSIPLLNTKNVTSMSNTFSGCSSLITMPLLNTISVTDMSNMFTACSSLTTIPLLNTSSVTNMSYMFAYSCYSLTTIPLLNTSKASNMDSMFYNCYALTTIPLLDMSKVVTATNMFYGCASLNNASVYNVNIAYNVRQLRLGSKAISNLINNLPMRASSLALTLTNNHGITTAISRSSTLTSGSSVVATTDTSGYTIGDAVIGTGMSYLTSKNMKLDNSNKVFTSVAHGLQDNTPIFSLFDINFAPTAKTLPASSNWANAAYGNGLHVCITETTGNLATVSADNGNTFTNYSIPAGTYYNLVFGDGTFVAFRYNSNKAITSTNGQTWTEITLPSSTTWKQACYFNGKFVCISTNGKSVSALSSDLTTWAEGTLPGAYEYRMACSATEVIIIRYSASGVNIPTAYSTDGVAWAANTTPPTFNNYGIYSITYGNGKYVAITNNIYTYESIDGINWYRGMDIVNDHSSIHYLNDVFVIVKSTTTATTVYTRANNSTVWEARTLPSGTWGIPSVNGSTFVFYSKDTAVANKVIVDPTFDKTHYQKFYLKNVTTDTFELSLTPGGTSIETQNIYTTGDFVYKAGSYITAINPNVSITLSAPATVSGTQTLTVRPGLDIMQAAAKNWTITY